MQRRAAMMAVIVGALVASLAGCSDNATEATPSENNSAQGATCTSSKGVTYEPGGIWLEGCDRCLCSELGEATCTPLSDCQETPADAGDEPDAEDDVAEPDAEEDTAEPDVADEDVLADADEPDADEPDAEDPDAGDDDAADVEDEERCVDHDFDGFFTCISPDHPDRPQEIDCDDNRFGAQPGGHEFPNNGFDDDCDGEVDEEPELCPCTLTNASNPDALGDAIDLCGGYLSEVTTVGDDAQIQVFAAYPGELQPHGGECMVAMSTGRAAPRVTQEGVQPGTDFNIEASDPDPDGPDEPVYDRAQLRLRLTPPPNAQSFRFSFMFMSSEWPEFLCDVYNDTFYAIAESNAILQGEPTNISLDRNGNEITVNAAFFEHPDDWTTDLGDTPFGRNEFASCPFFVGDDTCTLPEYCDESGSLGRVGSGSGWLTTQAPLDPEQDELVLVFSVHDEGDGILDSVVLIDDFQWQPFRTSVSTVKE